MLKQIIAKKIKIQALCSREQGKQFTQASISYMSANSTFNGTSNQATQRQREKSWNKLEEKLTCT